MNEQDYLELTDLVKVQLRLVGAGELADDTLYTYVDGETGERHLHEPRKLLIEMLSAFERYLSIRDRQTFDRALLSLNKSLMRGSIENVVVVTNDETTLHSLGDVPELAKIRSAVQQLIGALLEDIPPQTPKVR